MARKPIIRSNEHYYHLTARANGKDFYELPLDVVWEIMTARLGLLQKEYNLKIGAFVLMNNHFHLLLLTPKVDIDRVMYFFMKKTTLEMQKQTGRINKIFGGRYKGCLIEDLYYLLNAYKYICLNPVRANLVKQAQDYEFSTLNSSTFEILPFKVEEFVPLSLQARNRELEYRWINETFTPEETKSIKTGLSKSKFSFQKHRTQKRIISPVMSFLDL